MLVPAYWPLQQYSGQHKDIGNHHASRSAALLRQQQRFNQLVTVTVYPDEMLFVFTKPVVPIHGHHALR
tara:strand:- start:515 stop:721 length:207 start_codon:yes stop_codon:yes gene_type:complete